MSGRPPFAACHFIATPLAVVVVVAARGPLRETLHRLCRERTSLGLMQGPAGKRFLIDARMRVARCDSV